MNSNIEVVCTSCNNTVKTKTSAVVGGGVKMSEINLRAVAASRNCGIGYAKMSKFCAGLNLPKIFDVKSYQDIAKRVHDVAVTAAAKCCQESAEIIRQKYMADGVQPDDTGLLPITVSFDGTWHRRGHSSHYGVGVVVDQLTGLVVDTHTLSNYCCACARAPAKSSPMYPTWWEKHRPNCQTNYDGSANSMEVSEGCVLFRRSKNLRLRYNTVVCDGDSKTIQALNKEKIYGDHAVVKEDCVNHVAKRMWTAIDTMKKKLMGTPNSITGRGKVTKEVQDKLSGYYASQLKKNAPDVKAMRDGVYASLFHMVSTDADPHHKYCPDGDMSWRFFKRCQATGETPRPHKPTMSRNVADKLLPVYQRLTTPDLLQRCTKMLTQNVNECFNAQIWRRCPKTEGTSLRTVETAVAMATLEFNEGPLGFQKVLEGLGFVPGGFLEKHLHQATVKRLRRGELSMKPRAVMRRRHRKSEKARLLDMREAREGITYQPAAFNS